VDISRSYSNLPITKLAILLGPSAVGHSYNDLESILVDLFARNIIYGQIDAVNGVVYFYSGSESSVITDNSVKTDSLLKRIKEIECLSDRLRDMKARVLASPSYISKQRVVK